MRWQKVARLAIAAFVIVFTAVVFVAVRRPAPPAAPESTPRTSPDAIAETRGGTHRIFDTAGKLLHEVDFESQLTYPDGRNVLKNAVITLPDRGGRTLKIAAGEMEAVAPPEGSGEVSLVKGWAGVRLEASDGLEVTAQEATYDEKSGLLTVPGAVRFTRERLAGSGVGATYDRTQDVLWLLDQARIDVQADETGGGAVHATAKSAGLARAEHYLRLTGDARVVRDGQTLTAQDITVHLTEDDRAIERVEMRGDSRITGAAGAEGMSARDIDLTYAPDGGTLREARLMEQASVSLAGPAPRRVAGRTIELQLGDDGSTVTGLSASGNVQLDLPAEGELPARRIEAAVLKAGGPSGIQTATFGGGTVYRELQGSGRSAAGERVARARTLVVQTEPGLGAVKEAEFRGDVRIEDGGTTAGGRRAIYRVARDRFELLPSTADPGPIPSVNDGRMNVSARSIVFGIDAQTLRAEGDVRSSLQGSKPGARQPGRAGAPAEEGGRLPSLLKEGEPVNVTAERLEYDGGAGLATYTGHALLFQNETSIRADTIVLDDRQANLTATGNVRSVIHMEETNARTKTKGPVQTIATGDTLVYEDGRRLATYTSGPTARAHIVGTQGDVTADRIRLFLREGSNELQRAEAEGDVTLKEGIRTATGDHLTYTPEDETYVMTGRPVSVVEKKADDCRITEAASLTFRRTAADMRVRANGVLPATVRPCGAR